MALRVERLRALYGVLVRVLPALRGRPVRPMGRREPISGTLRTAAERLEAIAAMGFDVVYLPPVHPIGTTFRKGRNNTLEAQPGDPGSPWAIGSPEGGHDAIHPDLGTFDDFDAFVARAGELGLEIALDLALQASPDHPWVKEHPEWFTTRADGSIAYAENPPKKYQDIYPINFDHDPDGIDAEACGSSGCGWPRGTDLPGRQPAHQAGGVLGEGVRRDPRNRPRRAVPGRGVHPPGDDAHPGQVGFHQSYTYFTWRTRQAELTDYLTSCPGCAAFMRPNFFANTPDILPTTCSTAVRPPSRSAPCWRPRSPQLGRLRRVRAVRERAAAPGPRGVPGLGEVPVPAARLGSRGARRPRPERRCHHGPEPNQEETHLALHWLRNLRFHLADQPELICFSKHVKRQDGSRRDPPCRQRRRRREMDGTAANTVLVVVNLDPHQAREATVWLDMPALGMDWHDRFTAGR